MKDMSFDQYKKHHASVIAKKDNELKEENLSPEEKKRLQNCKR